MTNLSLLAVLLGVGYAAPQVYGLVKPAAFTEAARTFPRSRNWGVALMLGATAWFLYNLSQESIADLASSKNIMMVVFAAVGLATCYFVRDFLAIRGLAVLLLLLGKLMVDTGRPSLPLTSWALVIQIWAYVFVLAGMWLTVSPWRMRDWLNWTTANEQRVRASCGLRLAFAMFVAVLGIAKY